MKVLHVVQSRTTGVLVLKLCDLLLLAALVVMLLTWLLDPLRFNLGPMRLTIHGGWKPVLVPALVLGIRQLLARALKREATPGQTLWDRPGFRAATLLLLDALFIVSLLLIAAAWLVNPLTWNGGLMPIRITGWIHPALAAVLTAGTRWVIARLAFRNYPPVRGLWESILFKKLCVAIIVIYGFFGLFEAVLTCTRFNADLPPVVFQGITSKGDAVIEDTLPDAELIFRLEPGKYFAGRRINSLGFRDREVDPVKKPGVCRVICMGDSVTGQGRPGYSQYLHERLTNHPPTTNGWEAFTMGVHGYTALQGLRLFQKTGRLLAPDIVTLYFGWNDHFLSPEPDRVRMGLEMRPLAGRIFNLFRHRRVFRFVVWALSPIQHVAMRNPGAGRMPRVPPNEYQSTLTAFVREIRSAGAVPVLITAPRRSLSEGIVAKEYALSVEQAHRAHDEYVEITRRVARETNAELLDLARIFADRSCDRYFADDGIHFDSYYQEEYMTNDPPAQPGLMRIGEELDRKVRDITRTPAWQSHR